MAVTGGIFGLNGKEPEDSISSPRRSGIFGRCMGVGLGITIGGAGGAGGMIGGGGGDV